VDQLGVSGLLYPDPQSRPQLLPQRSRVVWARVPWRRRPWSARASWVGRAAAVGAGLLYSKRGGGLMRSLSLSDDGVQEAMERTPQYASSPQFCNEVVPPSPALIIARLDHRARPRRQSIAIESILSSTHLYCCPRDLALAARPPTVLLKSTIAC
jgi:hypothetical protein